MWKFLQNLFRSLFGGSDTPSSPEPTSSVETSKPVPPQTPEGPNEPEHVVETVDSVTGTLLTLQRSERSDKGSQGTLALGEEILCATLEGPDSPQADPNHTILPAGDYPLSLRTEGGIHSTYLYRFGDQHHGMLYLEAPHVSGFRYIQMGNDPRYAYGSILVGKEIIEGEEKNLLISYTDATYVKIYDQLAKLLRQGESISLRILDPS